VKYIIPVRCPGSFDVIAMKIALGGRGCHAEEVVELLGLQHPSADEASGAAFSSFVVPMTIGMGDSEDPNSLGDEE